MVHLIEFSDRLSVNDKMKLYELYSNALKTRRKIKDFITLSVKQDARKAFFSNPSVRYGKDDILDSDIKVSNSDRIYALKSGDENIVNFINSLKFKDKKYPNVESKVSEIDLEELKNKFN